LLSCRGVTCRSTSAISTLLALLNHENSDIAADAVEVLAELTDGDAVEDAVGYLSYQWSLLPLMCRGTSCLTVAYCAAVFEG
jgi:hypothetical protein